MATKKPTKKKAKKKKKQNHTLTIKQMSAIEAFIENGGNKSEAYRTAYNAENMAPETIWVKACELFKLGKVAVMVLELQEKHRERHNVTVDSLTEELDEARTLAKDEYQPSAMTGATMGKAKLHGLISDKQEISGPNGDPVHTQVIFVGAGAKKGK